MLNIAFLTLNMDENTKNKFEQIYYKYRNLLFTYARSIVNSNADAEDILQNAFIKISDNTGNIGEIDSKKTKQIFEKALEIWNVSVSEHNISGLFKVHEYIHDCDYFAFNYPTKYVYDEQADYQGLDDYFGTLS